MGHYSRSSPEVCRGRDVYGLYQLDDGLAALQGWGLSPIPWVEIMWIVPVERRKSLTGAPVEPPFLDILLCPDEYHYGPVAPTTNDSRLMPPALGRLAIPGSSAVARFHDFDSYVRTPLCAGVLSPEQAR